jgi:1,2-dihydroxy-3-keto-5-methylthiopentene dioxygenase
MDDSHEDQRLSHHREPKEFIPLEKLSGLDICSFAYLPNSYLSPVEVANN